MVFTPPRTSEPKADSQRVSRHSKQYEASRDDLLTEELIKVEVEYAGLMRMVIDQRLLLNMREEKSSLEFTKG